MSMKKSRRAVARRGLSALASAIESLESRRLLSATFARGTLTVTGTRHDDMLVVEMARRNHRSVVVAVQNDQQVAVVPATQVEQVILLGAQGNDQLVVMDGTYGVVPGGHWLVGGAGNDTLSGGSRDDRLEGDAGNDVLVGGGGNDLLDGGAGDDDCSGGSSYDRILSGDGHDTFHPEDDTRREIKDRDANNDHDVLDTQDPVPLYTWDADGRVVQAASFVMERNPQSDPPILTEHFPTPPTTTGTPGTPVGSTDSSGSTDLSGSTLTISTNPGLGSGSIIGLSGGGTLTGGGLTGSGSGSGSGSGLGAGGTFTLTVSVEVVASASDPSQIQLKNMLGMTVVDSASVLNLSGFFGPGSRVQLDLAGTIDFGDGTAADAIITLSNGATVDLGLGVTAAPAAADGSVFLTAMSGKTLTLVPKQGLTGYSRGASLGS